MKPGEGLPNMVHAASYEGSNRGTGNLPCKGGRGSEGEEGKQHLGPHRRKDAQTSKRSGLAIGAQGEDDPTQGKKKGQAPRGGCVGSWEKEPRELGHQVGKLRRTHRLRRTGGC